MAGDGWDLEQMERAWKVLAEQKQITAEQARTEYLLQKSQATTVNAKGEAIADHQTRALAKRMLAMYKEE